MYNFLHFTGTWRFGNILYKFCSIKLSLFREILTKKVAGPCKLCLGHVSTVGGHVSTVSQRPLP